MPKRFIVLIDIGAPNVERAVTAKLKSLGTWWHWIPNVWLLHTDDESLTPVSIVEKLKPIASGRKLVFEAQNASWAGTQGGAGPQDMFDWMKKTWSGEFTGALPQPASPDEYDPFAD